MYASEGCIQKKSKKKKKKKKPKKKKKKKPKKPTSSISDHSVVKSFQTQYGVEVALKHLFDL